MCSQCKDKKRRFESTNFDEEETQSNQAIHLDFKNSKITPKIFLKISMELNTMTLKYKKMDNENQTTAESNLRKMEEEAQNIYKKYKVTEEEFNDFGEKHYREIETYLKENPDIESKLQ